MRNGLRRRFLLIAVVTGLLVSLPSVANFSATTTSGAGGLLNPGFEDGALGGAPANWTVVQPVGDSVTVVDTETPAEFGTFADMGNITVTPNRGNAMLRLGTPKRGSENQQRGANTVRQAFTSDQTSLRFAFRLFSWEPRGLDQFSFNLTDGSASVGALASQLVVPMADGTSRTCSALPCAFTLDVGVNGQFIDSGWKDVEITGVPTGVPLTLTYTTGGTDSESKATWAYFDDTSTPSVVKFSYAPANPLEGDLIQFTDTSFNPNPDVQVTAWQWTIAGETYTARNPLVIVPDEGTYQAKLRITTSDGQTAEISAGQTAADGTAIPAFTVGNAAPLAGALNIEAQAGKPAPLVGRFADQGWTDTHTAAWNIAGATGTSLAEDHLPALSTGIAGGTITTAGDVAGTLGVQDNDGGSVTTPFSVTVVPDDPARFEPNNALASAPSLVAGGSYLSYIQSMGDVDVYEVRLPGNRALPPGAEVLVTLRDLPADFDVALLATHPAGSDLNALEGDAGQVGFSTAAYARGAYARGAYARGAYARGAYARGAYARGAFGFNNIALSDLGFTTYDGSEIGGTDITLDELGLGSLAGTGIEIAGFSANRGTSDDTALARIDNPGTRLYVAVSGANGARSLSAYRLQVEASVPLDLESLLGSAVCTGAPLVTSGGTSGVVTLYDNPSPAKTLIVTQRERMRAAYNLDDAGWDAFIADLTALAQEPSVTADILSLPSDIYDNWDTHPCDVDAANAVASSARDAIQARMAGVNYVVIAGGDNIVPHRRVPDETIVSNERDYVLDSFIKPGRPLFASIVQGYNLTDDYFVDAAPTTWQGRELYIPDVPTGRLVETPGDIRAAAVAYVGSGGSLNPQTAYVTGYDFFADGSTAIGNNLDDKLATSRLVNDVWTANQLRCGFLGLAAGGLTNCTTSAVTALNAHFTHYGAFSASGFNNNNLSDFVASDETSGVASGALAGHIVFTMGCHAGLSVPDGDSEAPDAGLRFNPALDFPQALAQQRAILIASTGYGLGDDEGLGGTEKLLEIFSRQLVAGNVGAGDALVAAKRDYILSQSAPTVYDEKSLIQTVFYGLPMYRVVTPASGAGFRAANAVAPAGDIALTTTDGASTITTSIARQQVTAPQGTYYTAAGEYQATAGRAIQPKIAQDIAEGPPPVKDVMLMGATYTDIVPFDPVIARPTNEWEEGATEPQPCIGSFWPASIARVNSLDIGGSLLQKLVVTAGQFRCTDPGAPATGIERLYNSASVELLRCPAGERIAPNIHTVDLHRLGSDVNVTVDVSDASGIDRIVVLRINAGTITPVILDLALPPSGVFTIPVANAAFGEMYVVQVQDGACNVAVATGKGATLNAVGVDVGPDQAINAGSPNTFTSRIEAYATLLAPVSFTWDFGDGSFTSAVLQPGDITMNGDGSASFSLQHQYASGVVTPTLASIRVIDSAGGIGTDSLVAAIPAPDDDLDDDGILNPADNCPIVYNPDQFNTNGEPIILPKPVPAYNDATNPSGDRVGDACDDDDDGDGVLDTAEGPQFLSQFVWDTDGDRTSDGLELACGSNPLSAASNVGGTDTDHDRLPDACEAAFGANPADPDSDGDGVLDGVEVRYWLANPVAVDSDGDACRDDLEIASVNGDRDVNSLDLNQIAVRYGALTPEFRSFDSNGDGAVNSLDLAFTAQRFGHCPPAP